MDFRIVLDALTKIVYDIVNFIPRLVNGLIILVVGYLVALVVFLIGGVAAQFLGNTVTAEGSVVLPNGLLLESIIHSPQPPDATE